MKATQNSSVWTGRLAAFAASSCCILPLVAAIGGASSGFSSSLAWVEPLRPYLIAATFCFFGLAFYNAYRPKVSDACGCEVKTSIVQSQGFLWSVFAISLLLMAFPYYSKGLYSLMKHVSVEASEFADFKTVSVKIEGMTCAGCEEHVNHELGKIPGVLESTTSYNAGNAIVKFDQAKTDVDAIYHAVKNAGYEPQGIATTAYLSEMAHPSEVSAELITFYYTPLVCGAASHIGCGSRSKPLLLDLEQQPGVESAWLNRAGTALAIVWENEDASEKERKQVAKTLFQKHDVEFNPVTKRVEINDLLADFKAVHGTKGNRLTN